MAKKIRMIRRPKRRPKGKKEENILERLKKLSDSAPTAKLRGGSFCFDEDIRNIRFKDK